jgi:hypothetical protein
MTLPLPFKITDAGLYGTMVDPEAIQSNFDFIAKQLPVSRKNLSVENVHVVGDTDEPAFAGTFVNFDTTLFRGARFWKGPDGVVHVEGLVKTGGAVPQTIFTLPEGYRPGSALIFAQDGSGAFARVDVASTGELVHRVGSSATHLSINLSFRQEQ